MRDGKIEIHSTHISVEKIDQKTGKVLGKVLKWNDGSATARHRYGADSRHPYTKGNASERAAETALRAAETAHQVWLES